MTFWTFWILIVTKILFRRCGVGSKVYSPFACVDSSSICQKRKKEVLYFSTFLLLKKVRLYFCQFFFSRVIPKVSWVSPPLSLSHICFSCLYLFCLLITRNNNSVIKFYSFDKENKVGKSRTSINIVNEAVGHVNIDLKTKVTIQVF